MTGRVRGLGDRCLRIAQNANVNGTQAVMWDCNGSPDQEWEFQN